ncbi:MAG TPA: hypothetical protein VF695_08305, partial [Sphingomonas sp.]
SDVEFDAWMSMLPPAPGIRHTDNDDSDMEAHVESDAAAGRVYDHAIVSRWLRTAGEPNWRPFGEWIAAQDG